jgi:hypothetical protein
MQISELASHKLRRFFSPTGVQGFARARDVALVLRMSVSRRVVFSQVCATARNNQIMFSFNRDHKVQSQSAKDNEIVKDELELYMKRMKHRKVSLWPATQELIACHFAKASKGSLLNSHFGHEHYNNTAIRRQALRFRKGYLVRITTD